MECAGFVLPCPAGEGLYPTMQLQVGQSNKHAASSVMYIYITNVTQTLVSIKLTVVINIIAAESIKLLSDSHACMCNGE